MMDGLAAIAMWLAAGGLVGWTIVPRATDVLLRRAYERSRSWWWDCCGAYVRFKQAHPEREPSPSARGEEGALGLWLDDALSAARRGSLVRERARALLDAGIAVDEAACDLSEEEKERSFSFSARLWQRAACLGACAAASAGIGLLVASGASPLQAAALACCALAMAVAIACDLRARTVPLETCAVLAGAGALFQVSACGLEGLAVGAAYAAAAAIGCVAVNRLLGRFGRAAAVGYGDVRCMAALSLACGSATPWGFAACYACAGAFSIGGLAARRLSASDGIPMAPFLALWLAVGAAVSVV